MNRRGGSTAALGFEIPGDWARDSVNMAFSHTPVMVPQVIELVSRSAPQVLVDGTVGGAGHAGALLREMSALRLFALDRDPEALAAAERTLAEFGPRFSLIETSFSQAPEVLAERGVSRVDAALVDLGVSSHQLNSAPRGFSFRHRGPLDMRMNPSSGRPVYELLKDLDLDALTSILRDYGEERHARRVARAILEEKPETTEHLATLVCGIVPRSLDGIHPATRTFQALRIYANQELEEIRAWCQNLPSLLADGGIGVVISFHSLEDRVVKHAFRDGARSCVCPPRLPVCRCETEPVFEVLTPRPLRPSSEEIEANPRARSAVLRAVRRLPRRLSPSRRDAEPHSSSQASIEVSS